MSRRIKFQTWVHCYPCKRLADGYRPTESSRFAVTRIGPDAPWNVTHVKTGMSVGSLLPAVGRKLTMTDKLAIAAAWEAQTHLDWSAFDELPAIGPNSSEQPKIDQDKVRMTARAMHDTARQVLGLA